MGVASDDGSQQYTGIPYQQIAGKITGIVQILCGAASFSCGIMVILIIGGMFDNLHDPPDSHGGLAYPVWGGCIYIVTGFIGVVAHRNNRDIIAAYLLTSIISVGCAAGQLYWEGDATVVTKCSSKHPCVDFNLSFVMHFMAIIIAFAEIVTALVAVGICSHAICCRELPSRPRPPTPPPQRSKQSENREPYTDNEPDIQKPEEVKTLPKSWDTFNQKESPRFVFHPRRTRVNFQYY